MNGLRAQASAIYVLDRVKAFDPRCGGVTRLAFSQLADNEAGLSSGTFSQESVQGIQNSVSRIISGREKSEWKEKFERVTGDYLNVILTDYLNSRPDASGD